MKLFNNNLKKEENMKFFGVTEIPLYYGRDDETQLDRWVILHSVNLREEVSARANLRLLEVLQPVAERALRLANAWWLMRDWEEVLWYIAEDEFPVLEKAAKVLAEEIKKLLGEILDKDAPPNLANMTIRQVVEAMPTVEIRERLQWAIECTEPSPTPDFLVRIMRMADVQISVGDVLIKDAFARKKRKITAWGKNPPLGTQIYGDPGDADEVARFTEWAISRDIRFARSDARFLKMQTVDGTVYNIPQEMASAWFRGFIRLAGIPGHQPIAMLVEDAFLGERKMAYPVFIPHIDTKAVWEERIEGTKDTVHRVGKLRWMVYLGIEGTEGRTLLVPINGATLQGRIFDLEGFQDWANEYFLAHFKVWEMAAGDDGKLQAVSYRLTDTKGVYYWIPDGKSRWYKTKEKGDRVWDGLKVRDDWKPEFGMTGARHWSLWPVIKGLVEDILAQINEELIGKFFDNATNPVLCKATGEVGDNIRRWYRFAKVEIARHGSNGAVFIVQGLKHDKVAEDIIDAQKAAKAKGCAIVQVIKPGIKMATRFGIVGYFGNILEQEKPSWRVLPLDTAKSIPLKTRAVMLRIEDYGDGPTFALLGREFPFSCKKKVEKALAKNEVLLKSGISKSMDASIKKVMKKKESMDKKVREIAKIVREHVAWHFRVLKENKEIPNTIPEAEWDDMLNTDEKNRTSVEWHAHGVHEDLKMYAAQKIPTINFPKWVVKRYRLITLDDRKMEMKAGRKVTDSEFILAYGTTREFRPMAYGQAGKLHAKVILPMGVTLTWHTGHIGYFTLEDRKAGMPTVATPYDFEVHFEIPENLEPGQMVRFAKVGGRRVWFICQDIVKDKAGE